jgi:hypothetical protein
MFVCGCACGCAWLCVCLCMWVELRVDVTDTDEATGTPLEVLRTPGTAPHRAVATTTIASAATATSEASRPRQHGTNKAPQPLSLAALLNKSSSVQPPALPPVEVCPPLSLGQLLARARGPATPIPSSSGTVAGGTASTGPPLAASLTALFGRPSMPRPSVGDDDRMSLSQRLKARGGVASSAPVDSSGVSSAPRVTGGASFTRLTAFNQIVAKDGDGEEGKRRVPPAAAHEALQHAPPGVCVPMRRCACHLPQPCAVSVGMGSVGGRHATVVIVRSVCGLRICRRLGRNRTAQATPH